jgi:crossover junction endodeoxyribonuclease RuvC
MIVLGVDPGSRFTGYALVKRHKSNFQLIEGGVISTVATSKKSPKYNLDIPQRLLIIHQELSDVIDKNKPDAAAIESIFSYKSSEAAIRLGQARGVALMTLAQKGLSVEAYNPMTVKQSVGGHGKSGKDEIIRITSRLLRLDKPLQSDAADAAAIAITHMIRSTLQSKIMSNISVPSNKSALTPNQQKLLELQKKSSSKNGSKRSNLQDWLIHRPKR